MKTSCTANFSTPADQADRHVGEPVASLVHRVRAFGIQFCLQTRGQCTRALAAQRLGAGMRAKEAL